MMRHARQGWAAAAILSLTFAGCRHTVEPGFANWAETQVFVTPQEGASNGFDGIALAAKSVEDTLPDSRIDRTSFTPGMKATTIKETRDEIAKLTASLHKPVDFAFTPRKPFEPAPYQRGWRMLGRALAWRISEAGAVGNYDAAVSDAILAHKFGFALTGGSVVDASLGLSTVDEARQAITPFLSSMGSAQLARLSQGVSWAVEHRPPTEQTISNEERNMAMAVQYVQDSYRSDEYSALLTRLTDTRDAIKYLKAMKPDDAEKRPEYFQGFSDEAKSTANWLVAQSVRPVAKRTADPPLASYRPWRRLAKHFFTSGAPYLAALDSTLARTRLLALQSGVLSQVKAKRVAPQDLAGFSPSITQDPYTGQQFVYRASGPDHVLYSVGADQRDDGGRTDESFSTPDVVLER
jgi:hypothetical protein